MGKRRRIRASARTKTEAKALLLKMRRDAAAGLPPEQRGYTVGEAVESWLAYGMTGRDDNTTGEPAHPRAEAHHSGLRRPPAGRLDGRGRI